MDCWLSRSGPFSDQQVVRDGCFTRRIRKKKPAAEKVQAKTGRPAAKKSKAAPAKRGRPAKVVPAQRKERPVRKKEAPPQRKDTEMEEETESEQEMEVETETKIIYKED